MKMSTMTARGLSRRCRTALRIEYEAIIANGFCYNWIALISGSTAPDYNGRPLGDFLAFVERVVAAITRLSSMCGDRCDCTVLGQLRRPARPRRCRSKHLPILQKADVGGFVFPFANPRHQHEWRVLQKYRSPTIRSSSPA